MATIHAGQIVLADVPGAQHNPRPVVVIRPPAGADPNDIVFVTGISSLLQDPLPAHHVPLPYHRQGHLRTGMTRRCVAKCDWTFTIEQRVWRASGPFVEEALELVTSIDATLDNLVSRGYPIEPEADKVHAALERLETIYNREIDEAEALQAAGEWTFVAEEAPPAGTSALSTNTESEDDHDE